MSKRVMCAFVAALGLAACGKHAPSTPVDLTKELGEVIKPPLGLDKLRNGMTVTEAMQAVPALTFDAHAGMLTLAKGGLHAVIDTRQSNPGDDLGRLVETITVNMDGTGGANVLAKAWGMPAAETHGHSAETGWGVDVRCGADSCRLRFERQVTPDVFRAALAPPPPLDKLRIGMTKPEVDKLVDLERVTAVSPYEGVRLKVNFTDDRVSSIEMTMPGDNDNIKLLTIAWGPARNTLQDGHKGKMWLDPETTWRATLTDKQLVFVQFRPLATLLGAGARITALEAPIVGKTPAEVISAYPGFATAHDGSVWIRIAPFEWGPEHTVVGLVKDGKVAEAMLALSYEDHNGAKEELATALAAKWGAPKPATEDGHAVDVYHAADPRIFVIDSQKDQQLQLFIR